MKFKINISKFNELLAINGYNKNSFARASMVSYPTLQRLYKTQEATPKIAKLIADCLNIELQELFTLIK